MVRLEGITNCALRSFNSATQKTNSLHIVFSESYKNSAGNNYISKDLRVAYLKTKELEEQFSVLGSRFSVGGRRLLNCERAKAMHWCMAVEGLSAFDFQHR
jgi:hypothetical protein